MPSMKNKQLAITILLLIALHVLILFDTKHLKTVLSDQQMLDLRPPIPPWLFIITLLF